jgi:fused signal recognition particle receptor
MTEEPESGAASGAAEPDLAAGTELSRRGFMARLRDALVVPAVEFVDWDAVEESLIAGDVGPLLAARITDTARRRLETRQARSGVEAVRQALEGQLPASDAAWEPRPASPGGPAILLVVGVNGTGKTTTIAKIAARERARSRSVLLAAADTFRAAAIDQLRVWAERTGSEIVSHAPGADPGAVVYDALDAALARGTDTVIVDTAGRLHTKVNLLDELAKIRRIIDRRLPGAVAETLFVLDATSGQNGLAQARAFHDAVGLTGIVLTKLDSTARGGIVFAISDAVGVPIRYVGVGERAEDLVPFGPRSFVEAMFGPQA